MSNLLSKLTPWPWEIGRCKEGSAEIQTAQGAIGEAYYSYEGDRGEALEFDDDKEAVAVAELWALAPDHALLLAATIAGKCCLMWLDDHWVVGGLPAGGEFMVKELDPFGCPILTPELRAALQAVLCVADRPAGGGA